MATEGTSSALFKQIDHQRRIGGACTQMVQQVSQPIYFPSNNPEEIECEVIGSYATGTMLEGISDIDILVLNVPFDEKQGFTDWAPISTFAQDESETGLVKLEAVRHLDAKLAQMIEQSLIALEKTFNAEPGKAVFGLVRSWPGYEGVVCCISIETADHDHIELEIILFQGADQFGLEHTRRFRRYLGRVRNELGSVRAATFIQEIRDVKEKCKQLARNTRNQTTNREKKVAGFVIEALFTCQFPPISLTALRREFRGMQNEMLQTRYETMADQTNELIGEGLSLTELINHCFSLGSITNGGWMILQSALDTLSRDDHPHT